MRTQGSAPLSAQRQGDPAIPLVDQIKLLREAFRCPECGKTTSVVNVAGHRRPFKAEHISAETHCLCPGSPALEHYQLQAGAR